MRVRGDWALPVGVAATLLTLVAVFYYPVGSVLASAVSVGGRLTLSPLVAVLGDPFYTGAFHSLVTEPTTVPRGFVRWVGSGTPSVRLGLFGFTAYQALLSTLASVAVGLPGAYLLARFEFPGRRFVRSVTILPFVLPSIMVAVGFLAMFGRTGLLNDLLGVVGLGPLELTFTLELIVLAHAFYNAPLVTRLVTAAWESVDADRVETARTLGATPRRAFRDVTLPQLLPALLTASVLTFVFTFMSFPLVLALGGLQLATVEVWLYARVRDLALTEAATLGALETALSLGLVYVYLRFEAMQIRSRGESRGLARTPLLDGWRSLLDPRRLGLLAYGAVVLVLFVGPLASLVIESVTTPSGRLTLDYYAFLLSQQSSAAAGTTRPLPAIVNSLLFGAGALLLALPMGVVVSVVATRDGRGSRLAEALLTAPLAVSGIVLGLGMLRTLVFGTTVFGHRITLTGPVAIVAAHAVAGYPFVSRNVTPALSGVDDRLGEAARALGADRTAVLTDIELPLVAPALVAGAAFAFAISVGEFDSTVLLAEGLDSATMPVALERYIGNRSLGPNLGPATAMGTVLLAVTTVSFVIIDRVGGRWER
ncbi:ABC transporter permease [Haloarcula nitratireducens]|uniref:Iron ABC transporter permease n=1 Tax=Haloarcula nitratireducens TaxID=2487749 RepID=A0AAW4PEQ8_9EURY|nr:iron ABC transporter permease [Halomicroarcula nitratireducens]MBX0296424.1 iron ABC transporter permease [Halomicroarcula nitratireducens]